MSSVFLQINSVSEIHVSIIQTNSNKTAVCVTHRVAENLSMQCVTGHGPRRMRRTHWVYKRLRTKGYTRQILSYKIASFCEQVLKIGANDASGKMLQYAL